MRIQNAKIYRDGGWSSGDLYMNQGIFCSEDSGGESIDAQGWMAVPGFIDIHTHGAFGNDVNDAQEDQYRRIAHFSPLRERRHGMRAFSRILRSAPAMPWMWFENYQENKSGEPSFWARIWKGLF